ncbi:hypothetical protein BDZ89DRAFT_1061722 [Hymenopellis radicata]|nr:hypothetical protein BDZ89DRAFT_1061722 [Hymenopellis radicata]
MAAQASLESPFVFEATPQRCRASTSSFVLQANNEATGRRTPLGDKPFNLNTSSNLFKDVVGSKYTSATFHPLPPLPRASSLQFSNTDFAFQSFTVSPLSSPPLSAPLHPSPLAESHIVSDGKDDDIEILPPITTDVFQIPAFSHPNSPYVPWTSPIRRDIIRPSTPTSLRSHYSRPLSRSGAQAPEPADIWLPRTFRKVTKSIHNIRRVLKRSMSRFAKRVSPTRIRHPSFSSSSGSPTSIPRNAHLCPRSSSAASLESTSTNTLAIWLATRKREADEWDLESHRFMTLVEYDRAGSWTRLSMSDGLCHDNPDDAQWSCDFHDSHHGRPS